MLKTSSQIFGASYHRSISHYREYFDENDHLSINALGVDVTKEDNKYPNVISSVLELLQFDSNSDTNTAAFYYYFIILIGIEFAIKFSLELGSFLLSNS